VNKDMDLEQKEEDFAEYKNRMISLWVKNGVSSVDAEQLFQDMVDDPNHNDPDMELHFDITIDERLEKYGGSATTLATS
jgi:hypothetical protein